MDYYIGVDLGGTNVRVAKITKDGEVVYSSIKPSLALEGPTIVTNNIIDMLLDIPNYQECKGIGVAVPGPVDVENGWMNMSTNLKDFVHFPIAKEISDKTGLPTFLDNDANAAGLAEALLGAGKGEPIVYYTTLSTGIGGALVVDGKVVAGKHGYAGEIANIIVDRNREKVNHLNAGAVENWASGRSLKDRAIKELPDENIEHAGDVFRLAEEGNATAIKLVDGITTDLAQMYSTIAHVVDPCCFVIGGGMMKSKELFLPKVIEKYKNMVHPPMREVKFVQAVLKEPGIVGAAMLPLSRGL